nr:MAG TPA: hypothetical protein [Caudoviricetes sp.]
MRIWDSLIIPLRFFLVNPFLQLFFYFSKINVAYLIY